MQLFETFKLCQRQLKNFQFFLKNTVPEINWRETSAFRNVLVHNYLGLDLEQIWEIVQNDIPSLKTVIFTMA